MPVTNSTFEISPDNLNSSKIEFLDITTKLNDYNEINSLNDHLLTSNTQELERLQTFNNQVKTKLMKAKQSYLLTDYGIHEYRLNNNLLLFSTFMVCIAVLIVTSIKSKTAAIWACVGLAVFYLIVIMMILSSNVKRRKYAWNQWYWDPAVSKK